MDQPTEDNVEREVESVDYVVRDIYFDNKWYFGRVFASALLAAPFTSSIVL